MEHYTKFELTVLDKFKKTPEYTEGKGKGKGKRKTTKSELIITLDTEVTSYFLKDGTPMIFDKTKDNEFYKTTTKQGLCYIWMMSIDGVAYYGRHIEEVDGFIRDIMDYLKKINNNDTKQLIFVHNLGYDFPFLLNSIKWGNIYSVFAMNTHKPVRVQYNVYDRTYLKYMKAGVEFRCSYFLTNMSLNACAKAYNTPVQKLVGDLDYNVLRTPLTPLTPREMGYCENDVIVLHHVIEKIAQGYKSLHDIPLTQTGKVRSAVKEIHSMTEEYQKIIDQCRHDLPQYELLIDAYSGGYTHSNARNTDKVLKNVSSYDFGSSYPYEMTTKKYPMEKFKSIEKVFHQKYIDDSENYAILYDIVFTNLRRKTDISNTYLSIHKKLNEDLNEQPIDLEEEPLVENGRVISIERARYVLTDVDMDIVKQTYDYDIEDMEMYVAKKDYLPKELIEYVLENYRVKTEFKGVTGKEDEYRNAKEIVNSIYGLLCQKILRNDIKFHMGEWAKFEPYDFDTGQYTPYALEEFRKYMREMYVFYGWGVWVTAYARHHLWGNIIAINDDVVYCDTDSIKFIGNHDKVIQADEVRVDKAIDDVCNALGISRSLYEPKCPKGIPRKLGVFDYEGCYDEFKTLGAKKYCYSENGKISVTVSGLNKTTASKVIKHVADFRPGLKFDYDGAGKKEIYYNNNQEEVTFSDGYTSKYKLGSCLKPTTYTLDITGEYQDIIEMHDTFNALNISERFI